ncbi:MAG: YceI family protein [Bacteroidetes bacterium]|nr:MAG: YceI family protein [Bacteroidota bacterium]
MKKTLFALALLLATTHLSAQIWFTRSGKISFYSDAPLEKIEAHNKSATSVLNTADGRLEFAVLIKGFQFEKALMQEHFNENYMESDKYPKATFKGSIVNIDEVDFGKDGTYPVVAKGQLTIHGVTREVEVPGQITVTNGQIAAQASFEVAVADYGIEIPAVVRDNIAKVVRVDVDVTYEPFEKGS